MKTPAYWYNNKSYLSLLLYPLSYLWLMLSFFKKFFTRRHIFNMPIICVGNVIAGGGGKTPLVIEICKYYKKNKTNIHVIYKKYKSRITEKAINVNDKKKKII